MPPGVQPIPLRGGPPLARAKRLSATAAVAAGLAVAVGLVLTSVGGDGSGAAAAAALGPRSAGAPAETARVARGLGSGQAVTLAFGGDVHFESPIRQRLDEAPAGVLAAMAPVLSRADVAMVNLETAVTDRGEAAAKQYVFRAPPTAFEALRAAGVDVAT